MRGRTRLLLPAALALVALFLAHPAAPSRAACVTNFSVTGINPSVGFVSGGTSTTISGTGFTACGSVSGVTFGGTAASFTAGSDTSFTATAPSTSTPGQVTVTVTFHPTSGPDQTGTTSYTYKPLPNATSITPTAAFTSVGTKVTISGNGFNPNPSPNPNPSSTSLTINGTAVSISTLSDTQITATAPTGIGADTNVPVVVSVTLSSSTKTSTVPGGLTYVSPPSVSSISPTKGPEKGGSTVYIQGSSFNPGHGATAGASSRARPSPSAPPKSRAPRRRTRTRRPSRWTERRSIP